MTTTWPPNFLILGIGCQKVTDLIKQMTGVRMDITVYGGGELMYWIAIITVCRIKEYSIESFSTTLILNDMLIYI